MYKFKCRFKSVYKSYKFKQSYKLLFYEIQDKPTKARSTTAIHTTAINAEVNTEIKTRDV